MNEIKISSGKENYTPIVVETLRNCADGSKIVFENGTYDFYADGARKEYLFPVCNQSGEKRIVFPLFDKKNITIDGNGAKFVLHDRVFPFAARNCEGVTLSNFSVTFSFMRYCACEVSLKKDGLRLKIDKSNYNYGVNENGNLVFYAGDTEFTTSEKYYFMQQERAVCFVGAGKRNYEPIDLPAGFMETVAEKTSDGVFLKYLSPKTKNPFANGKIVISYDEDRSNDNFFFEKCKFVKVENVKLFRGAGMGIITQLCENVEISGVEFKAGENGDETYSTTADGLFFTNDTGKVYIHDCLISNTMDDAISIHGVYAKVDKIFSSHKFSVRFMHDSHSGYNPFFAGDTLLVSDCDSQRETGFITIKNSCMGNDVYCVTIETEEDVSRKIKEGDYVENHDRSPEVVIENNVFNGFPAIRLASARKILFSENVVQNGTSLCVNDLLTYWHTYGKSDDVSIIRNHFAYMQKAISVFVDRNERSEVFHGKIEIDGNVIMKCKQGLEISRVENLTLCANAMAYVDVPENVIDCKNICRKNDKQLLMRRDRCEFEHTPVPEGYSKFTFIRGGKAGMTEEEYIKGWFEVCPKWTVPEFEHFYNDDKIPDDGYFLILDKDNKIVGHSNVQLNEHKEGTATVHFVEVKTSEKGKRLGYVATEMVLDYVDSHNILTTYLTTDEFRIPAIKIYLKLGFKPVMWDGDMRERWFPILKQLGYNEIYDEDEKLVKMTL